MKSSENDPASVQDQKDRIRQAASVRGLMAFRWYEDEERCIQTEPINTITKKQEEQKEW